MKCRSEKHPHPAERGWAGPSALRCGAALMGGGGMRTVGGFLRTACHGAEPIYGPADCRYLAFVVCPTGLHWSSSFFFVCYL